MNKKIKNIFSLELLISTFYIVNQYSFKNLSIGVIFLIGYILYSLFKNRFFNLYLPFIYLYIYILFHDIAKIIIGDINYFLLLERTIYFIFLVLIVDRVNQERLYKVWKIISIIVMLGIFIQFFQIIYFHQKVTMLNIFPFLNSGEKVYLMRPHSFFKEPAAYIVWILPFLCMCLEKKEKIFSIIVSVSILCSTSSIGCFLLCIVWIYYILIRKKTKKIKKIFLGIIFIMILLAIVKLDFFSLTLNKIKNISFNNTSNYVRTIFGFELFIYMPLLYKIMGIPYSSIKDFLLSREVNLEVFNLKRNIDYLGFVNGISNCAINYGVIGLYFYLYLFYRLLKDIKRSYRSLLIVCFISIFMQSVFYNAVFVVQLSVLLGCGLSKNNKIVKWR